MNFSDCFMMSPHSLSSQTILITGAAGRIGSATAKHALMAGASVILTDIASQALEQLVAELSDFDPGRIHALVVDIANPEEINSLVIKALSCTGSIDGAVHSAYPRSKGWGTKFEELKADDLYQDLSMQLGGAILFSKTILRCFQDQGHGSLIHLSSIQGVQAPKFEHYAGTSMSSPIEYAAIKSGIISISRWLAKYSANQNIRVNCVSPGGILDGQPEEFLKRYRQSCTNIGMLSAEQVASVITFLLSPDAAAINGQNLIVDDGWTL
jgi:NAD(P)-dependent dehydrogenase (short-subunit alcohol dehydrogenase family)